MAATKEAFDELSRRLNLDSDTQASAWLLVDKFYALPQQFVPQRETYPPAVFFAAAIYVNSSKAGLSISQLLAAIDTKVSDLFAPLEVFISAMFQDEARREQSRRLKYLQTQYLVTTLIYRKYVDVYDQYFIRSEHNTLSDPTRSGRKRSALVDPDKVFAFGWLLLLVSRSKLVPPNSSSTPDYFRSLQLLVCCLDLLLGYAPANVRKLDLKTLLDSSASSDGEKDTLKLLCTAKELPFSLMKPYQDHTFIPFLVSNCSVQSSGAMLWVQSVISDSDHPQFPGLLEATYIDQNVKSLTKEYEELLRFGTCNFDERQLLYSAVPPTTGPATPQRTAVALSFADSTAATTSTALPRSSSSFSGSLASPGPNRAPPATPTRMTMSAVSWLMNRVSTHPTPAKNAPDADTEVPTVVSSGNGPSPRLAELCQTVGVSATGLAERLSALALRVSFPTDNDTRKTQAIKLYYRVLENIITLEEANQRAYGGLLQHDKFHRSVFAAMLEIVLSCYNVVGAPELEFPHFISLLELKAFDFGKVIESVIRAEPTLPRSIVKHLVTIEERILESMAWEESSPLWFALDQETVRAALSQRLQSTGTPSKPNRSACEVFTSPRAHRPGQRDQRSLNTTLPVEIFFRKVSHLASLRIHKLCTDLNRADAKMHITDKLVKQVEYAFIHIATQTKLLLNRHIDQVIMAVVYALCKVSMPQTPITFKALIDKYNTQPQSKPAVYRFVRLGPGEPEDDIIKFYNKIFLPQVQQFVLQFQLPAGQAEAEGGDEVVYTGSWRLHPPLASPLPMVLDLSSTPARLPPGQGPYSPLHKVNNNLFVSPLKPSAMTPLLLGKTGGRDPNASKISYQFGLSPQKSLDDINRSVNAGQAKGDGPRKRLFFDDPAAD